MTLSIINSGAKYFVMTLSTINSGAKYFVMTLCTIKSVANYFVVNHDVTDAKVKPECNKSILHSLIPSITSY
jgi:hypothetical protein